MNLLDAIKSGKQFTHKTIQGHERWYKPKAYVNELKGIYLTYDMAISDDWEIEPEKKIELSWEQIEKAIGRIVIDVDYKHHAFKEMKKELGFE